MRLPGYRSVAWLTVALALSLGSVEAAEVAVGREATVRSVVGLNVRSEPSPDAPVLTVADGGDFVNVLEASGDWYRVEYDGTVGWVSGEYLEPARDRGAVSSRGNRRGDAVVTESGVLLRVPYRSQLDGSAYAGANCGPTSIGMALEAFGTHLPTTDIRRTANAIQGTTGWYDSGTSLDVLAAIASRKGLVVRGLYTERGYDRWTPDDVRRALRNGHVVLPQVHLATLPGHEQSNRAIDHYILIVGYEGDRFIYHDPAFGGSGGQSLWISEERLTLAWKRGDYPFAAFSLGPGAGMEPLVGPPAPTAPPPAEPAAPPAQPKPPAAIVTLADRQAASAAIRRLLEAESATRSSTPQPDLPLAEPPERPALPASGYPAPGTQPQAGRGTRYPSEGPGTRPKDGWEDPAPGTTYPAPGTMSPGPGARTATAVALLEPAPELAPADPPATPASARPATAPRFRPMRAWPIVLAAALGLALLGSRRVVPAGPGG